MLCEQLIECREVASFLIIHVFHQWLEVGMCFHNRRCLSSVDKGSSKFSSLVDTKGSVQVSSLFFGERASFLTVRAFKSW